MPGLQFRCMPTLLTSSLGKKTRCQSNTPVMVVKVGAARRFYCAPVASQNCAIASLGATASTTTAPAAFTVAIAFA